MSEEGSSPGEGILKGAAEAVRGVLQGVPIYTDMAQPAAKELGTHLVPVAREVGKSLLTVSKAVNIALLPLSGAIWGFEKIRDEVIPALAKRFSGREDKIIT